MRTRKDLLRSLKNEEFDLLIIGGGVTGVGIALDAASRGLKTALVEKEDFGSGTSSRSTKLIHGGLRYLQSFEFKLVREVGRERSLIHKLAPHLVIPEKMLLPLTKKGKYGKLDSALGLWFYDQLAVVPKADRRKMLSKQKALKQEPLLSEKGLLGAGFYSEYRTDDARLTIEITKTAIQKGAICLNYCSMDEFVYENGIVCGIHSSDQIDNDSFIVRAKYVVNAAGPWVDVIRKKDHPISGKQLHLTKGVHIVVPHTKLPLKQSIYFDVPDGRMIFAIPRLKTTYIGTTDTDFNNTPDLVGVEQEDINYLISAVNQVFPTHTLSAEDIVASWAGLRPLIHEKGKSASEISRKDEIFISPKQLISIAGGKLTGYRVMAKKTVDLIARKMQRETNRKLPSCKTKNIPLTRNPFQNMKEVTDYITEIENRLKEAVRDSSYYAQYLVANYGSNSDEILSLMEKSTELSAQSLLMAEFDYCINNELATNLTDFFDRRTGRIYFDTESIIQSIGIISEHAKKEMGWTTSKTLSEQKKVLDRCISSNS
ncbi:MAG: glycerol-3-phosphate dehydrogenase/oxidase [Bacteroidota bacterium]|nr:glycerol-3-phosphate dehydrogenase/oxidase [Bacteroidota bacterium]